MDCVLTWFVLCTSFHLFAVCPTKLWHQEDYCGCATSTLNKERGKPGEPALLQITTTTDLATQYNLILRDLVKNVHHNFPQSKNEDIQNNCIFTLTVQNPEKFSLLSHLVKEKYQVLKFGKLKPENVWKTLNIYYWSGCKLFVCRSTNFRFLGSKIKTVLFVTSAPPSILKSKQKTVDLKPVKTSSGVLMLHAHVHILYISWALEVWCVLYINSSTLCLW